MRDERCFGLRCGPPVGGDWVLLISRTRRYATKHPVIKSKTRYPNHPSPFPPGGLQNRKRDKALLRFPPTAPSLSLCSITSLG